MTVQMVTPERAGGITNTTPREIYRCIENDELHFVETSEGELFICCYSLNEKTKKRDDEIRT